MNRMNPDKSAKAQAAPEAPKAPETPKAPEAPKPLRGRVITGLPLEEGQLERIIAAFERLTGEKVLLTVRVDKKQIAGVRVELGGKCYDGTLLGELKRVKRLLTHPEEEDA
mgnify:CR=1 FL=1